MKHYKVKNYKGNLLESIKTFQEKYPKIRICEAIDIDGALRIAGEEMPPEIPSDGKTTDHVMEFGCKLLRFAAQVHIWHLNCTSSAQHTALQELYEVCDDVADKILEAQIGILGRGISANEWFQGDTAKMSTEFGEDSIAEIEEIKSEASNVICAGVSAGIAPVLDDFIEACNSVIYKLKRLD